LRKDGKSPPAPSGAAVGSPTHLLNRPGEVVTREDLRQRLWPADTFVDYDHSLNTAVNKLREAFKRLPPTTPASSRRFRAEAIDSLPPIEAVDSSAGSAKPEENRSPEVAPAIGSESSVGILSDHSRPAARLTPGGAAALFSHPSDVFLLLRSFSGQRASNRKHFLSRELQHPAWIFVPCS